MIIDKVKTVEELLSENELLAAQKNRTEILRKKLEDQSITVAVIGQFKRGKSATVNALLGDKLLPTGIVPVTSAVTKISYGEKNVAVEFVNGLVKNVEPEDLHYYINEQENPGNVLGVSDVVMKHPSDFLKGGLTFVDTPGVGSIHKNNSIAAYDFVKESDAVIFMLSVDSPINEIEIDFLRNTRSYAAKFFFAVNKIDTIPQRDLESYIAYCKMLLCGLMDVESVNIFPISAKTGAGLDVLKTELQDNLRAKTRDILEESAVLKLIDIIGSSLSQIELYWKVLLMTPVQLRSAMSQMDRALAQFKEKNAALVKDLEADREIIIPGLEDTLKIRLNEFKTELSSKVVEIYGMDYAYEIEQLEEKEAHDTYTLAKILGDEYLAETNKLCDELGETLNKVLMFRNDDAVEVTYRIFDLNKLTRTLKRIKRELEAM